MSINKKELEDLILRIEGLEKRLDKLDPISKRKLPSKKEQVEELTAAQKKLPPALQKAIEKKEKK